MNRFPARPDAALLIVGHGSTVNPDSAAPSLVHAAAIRRWHLFAQVACVFWKEEPSLRDWPLLFDPAEIRDVFIVPNFISEGYFTRTVIPRELDLDRLPDGAPASATHRADSGQTWHYCPPAGNHPAMTDLLLQRAHEAAPGVPEAETSLLIVGHGTSLNDNSAVAAKQQVEAIRALGRYAAVLNTYMEEPPLISDWVKLTDTPNVVVVRSLFPTACTVTRIFPSCWASRPSRPPAPASARGAGRCSGKIPAICTGVPCITPAPSARRRASRTSRRAGVVGPCEAGPAEILHP